jgi:hypothetical protein
MAKSREQLESEINGTSYFSISGDNTEALKKSELYKLSALVFDYCNRYMYEKGRKASLYSEEIYKCTINCLNNFKPEIEVPFLHYLKAALSKSIKKAEYKEKRTIQKLGQSHLQTQEGEDFSLIDSQASPYLNPEDEVTEKDRIRTIFNAFDDVFKNKQERVKPYLSKLISREYFEDIVRFLGKYSFVDVEMVKSVLFHKETLPSQKDIAEMFGRHEADASRTINNFKKEVKEKLVKKC